MPKKTRQEKIIAELRRQLQAKGSEVTVKASPIIKAPSDPHLSLSRTDKMSFKSPSVKTSPAAAVQDYSYVGKELRRIVIITALAVGWEFLLYFLLPKLNLW